MVDNAVPLGYNTDTVRFVLGVVCLCKKLAGSATLMLRIINSYSGG